MKININIRDFLVRRLRLSQVTVSVHDVDELLQASQITAEQEIDLDELLRENRMIGHLWTIDDVHQVRPQLTDDQAWEVLRECEDRLNSEVGINWHQIEEVADDLFGEETQRLVRFTDLLEKYTDYEAQQNLVDLLADAMHWCQVYDADFDRSLAMAKVHFLSETKA